MLENLNYSGYERKAVCALENTLMQFKLPQYFHGSRSLPCKFLGVTCFYPQENRNVTILCFLRPVLTDGQD
jgi:hypothetical protein